MIEDALGLGRRRSFMGWLAVFVFTGAAWVFFRAESFSDALYVFVHSFDGITDIKTYFFDAVRAIKKIQTGLTKITVSCVLLALYDYASFNTDLILRLSKKNTAARWAVYILFLLVVMCIVFPLHKQASEFIYFQF